MNDVQIHRICAVPSVSVIVTVREEDVFETNLLASVQADLPNIELITVRNCSSQASALNRGLEAATADLVVCPHADVFFAPQWLPELQSLVSTCPAPWGVLGPAGTALGGQMWGTHSGLGMQDFQHVDAQTLDGSCLIIKKSTGLRFDERFTRFHMYDADICLQAKDGGLAVFVIKLHMEHRTKWTAGAGFGEAVQILQQKWKPRVPQIYTTVGTH